MTLVKRIQKPKKWLLMYRFKLSISGRGALYKRRSQSENKSGAYTRENAGMSSEKESENLSRRNPKDS